APRGDRARGPRCRSGPPVQRSRLRAARSARQGHHGQGRARPRRGAPAAGRIVMASVLIVAEHAAGRLNPSTARAVTCARAIDGARIDIAVLSADGAAVAAQAAALQDVSRVLRVDAPVNAEPLAAVLAPQVAALADGYTHLFAPSTTFGKDLLPRVAALLGVGQLSDIMAIAPASRFR